jgi:vacuolar-type H+-ATPase subunit H
MDWFTIEVVCPNRHSYKIRNDSAEARKALSSTVLTAASEKHKLGQEPRERIQSKDCRICQSAS